MSSRSASQRDRVEAREPEIAAPPEARDWDLSLPDVVLYAVPVLLALFYLFVAQANVSVFWGFDEGEPATRASSILLIACLLIAAAGARRPDLERPLRIVAGVLASVVFLALLDENLLWHEAIGRQVRHATNSLPRRITHYTDDVLILLAAIVGVGVIAYSIRYVARECQTPRQRVEMLPYLACVGTFAIAHGVLDIVGHGRRAVGMIWPSLPDAAKSEYVDRISAFEEICKLWTEWFVLLLLLKLLCRQRGPLVWSLLAATGSGMAVLGGLWAVDDVARGVPALSMGQPLNLIRNFHSLFALGWIWVAWLAMRWVCFRRAPDRGELTGVLLVLPLAPVLGGLIDPGALGNAINTVAGWLMPAANYEASAARHGLLLAMMAIPGAAAGLVLGLLIKRWPLSVGVAIAAGGSAFASWQLPSSEFVALVAVSGGLMVVSLLAGGRSRTALVIGAALALSTFGGNAWWPIVALSWAVFSWAQEVPAELPRRRTAALLAVLALQLAVGIGMLWKTGPAFLPNHDVPDYPGPVFDVIGLPSRPIARADSPVRLPCENDGAGDARCCFPRTETAPIQWLATEVTSTSSGSRRRASAARRASIPGVRNG